MTTTEEAERVIEVTGDIPIDNQGDTLIEQKIFGGDAIVKATMTSYSSGVFVDAKGKFLSTLTFNLEVSEYLKGSGATNIVALWVDGTRYDTIAEANVAEARNLANRDDQWDDRAAIIFLYDGASGLGTSLDAQFQLADHYLLAAGHRYFDDDRYSLHSTRNKVWLPAAGTGSNWRHPGVPAGRAAANRDRFDDHARRSEVADRRGDRRVRRR